MHIILMILKIIGIILLVLFGLVLLGIGLILFVPLRYSIELKKEADNEIEGCIRTTWLLHILSFRAEYKENLNYYFRVFGIPIKKSEKIEKEMDEEEKESDTKSENEFSKDGKTYKEKPVRKKVIKEKETQQAQNKSETKNIKNDSVGNIDTKKEEIQEIPREKEQNDKKLEIKKIEQRVEDKKAKEVKKEKKAVVKKKKKRQFNIKRKLQDCIDKIVELYHKAKMMWNGFLYKEEEVQKKIRHIADFFAANENHAGMRVLLEHGKKAFSHIWPKKWKGWIRFGLEDPAETGKALGMLAVLCGVVGSFPNIEPDFEQEIFEGNLKAKGRIRVATLLRIVIHVWRNEAFKALKRNFEEIRRVL